MTGLNTGFPSDSFVPGMQLVVSRYKGPPDITIDCDTQSDYLQIAVASSPLVGYEGRVWQVYIVTRSNSHQPNEERYDEYTVIRLDKNQRVDEITISEEMISLEEGVPPSEYLILNIQISYILNPDKQPVVYHLFLAPKAHITKQ